MQPCQQLLPTGNLYGYTPGLWEGDCMNQEGRKKEGRKKKGEVVITKEGK